MELRRIGVVKHTKRGCVIKIDEPYIKGLKGIEGFGHINVLDIKPYIPSFDRIELPKVPQWQSGWPMSSEESASFDWNQVFNF